MECSGELSPLVRLINIIEVQLESSSEQLQTMKHVSGNVEKLKLSINLARGLLLKEDLFLQVDNSWHHQLDALTSLCYDAEDVVSLMEYRMTTMNQLALLNRLKVIMGLPSRKVLMHSLIEHFMLNPMINWRQRLLKAIIREMRFHLELIHIQKIPVPLPMKPCIKRSSRSYVQLIGREADKETILNYLISDDENPDCLGISIIGMHGVGKSALALDIADDIRVKSCYYKVLWASLTGPFNHQDICLQEVASSHYDEIDYTQVSQSTLLNDLRYTKSLFVLDNLLDITSTEWFDFQSSYLTFSRGKILITSSNNDIALVTQTTRHYLHPLSTENCERVINCRSGVPEIDRRSLSAEVESLAKKCHGLPIVANFFGLQIKDENQRMNLLNKDLWEVPEFKKEILPSLTSTYSMLEPHLKKCFAYLSLFPRGYHFEMGNLIQLWIAEGFIEWPDKLSLQQICNEYLGIFERWLILRPSHIDLHDGRKYYEIHPFTYDLAKLVSSNTCFCLDDETHTCVLDTNIRHLSLSIQNSQQPNIWKAIQKPLKLSNSCLRTFLPLNEMNYISRVPTSFFKSVPHLRVLSLSKTGIDNIPYSIAMLTFLRYLDVSETSIRHLPEPLSKLSYLQILKLKNCPYLKHMPRKFKHLINLRHIDWEVDDMSRLMSIPPSIGSLTGLQRLPLFQVGTENGFRIVELKNMVHLQGSICITNLQHVQDQKEAEAAELSSKVSLEALELQWSSWYSNARKAAEDVLTALQPHKNLKELQITNYVGHEFPEWLSQLRKLHNLAIVNCQKLTSLPSFEHQTSLVNLKITGCSKLRFLPKLPPSVNSLIIKECNLLDPLPNLGSEGQLLPTSDNSRKYKMLEVGTYSSKGWSEMRDDTNWAYADLRSKNDQIINRKLPTEMNEESFSPIRKDDACEITEEELIESKLSAVEKIADTSKETESEKADTSKETESEIADRSQLTESKIADTSNETKSKIAHWDLFIREKLKQVSLPEVIEVSSSPVPIIDGAYEITEEELIESESSAVGKIFDTGKEVESKNDVRSLFRAELKRTSLADNEIDYHLEAMEEMRLLCIMSSHDYDFEEETLIQLWVARGFLKGEHKNHIGHIYFRILLSAGYIMRTGTNFTIKKDKYRANVDMFRDDLASLVMHKEKSSTSNTVLFHQANGDLHLSWDGDDFDERIPTPLRKNLNNLKALYLCNSSSKISSVPQYVFFALRLKVLHLGGTGITNLPSSIGNLVELRYLDLSHTLIEALPDNVQCLSKLQTLKLNNCERLLRLPGGMGKLTSLECLELDVLRQLTIMPRGMGALTKLETLSAFIVDNDEGRSIKELKNMNDLKGSFCISKLENVTDAYEARVASLESKKFLKELDLRWSNKHENLGSRFVHYDIEILHWLRPNSDLEQLCISCYGGESFPYWTGSPSFHMLNSITFFKCDNAELLPSLGQLPSLKSLTLMELNNVKEIGNIFRGLADDFIAFPSLETLEIIGLSQLEIWRDAKEGDYKSLCKIIVEQCPKLEGIPSSFFQLPALQHMEILHCRALTLPPVKRLPISLATLIIDDCPLVTKEFKKPKGKHWLNTNNVQDAWIDQEPITDSNRGKSRFISSCFVP